MNVLTPQMAALIKNKWTDGQKKLKIKASSDTSAGIYYFFDHF